jgi:transcriptional regulator with XRE-family HTH domain
MYTVSAVRRKIKVTVNISARAFRQLREALGETQLGMAKRLGMSPSGWQHWEYGKRQPRGAALKALRDICPDEEIRALFALESGISNLGSSSPPAPPQGLKSQIQNLKSPKAGDDVEAVRYYDDAVEALGILYEVATAGHPGAKEELRAEAIRLIERGAHWRDLKYTKVKK